MLILKFDFRKTKEEVGYKSLIHILMLNNNKKRYHNVSKKQL
jgi:hypothetical protein